MSSGFAESQEGRTFYDFFLSRGWVGPQFLGRSAHPHTVCMACLLSSMPIPSHCLTGYSMFWTDGRDAANSSSRIRFYFSLDPKWQGREPGSFEARIASETAPHIAGNLAGIVAGNVGGVQFGSPGREGNQPPEPYPSRQCWGYSRPSACHPGCILNILCLAPSPPLPAPWDRF